ncbi:MAG: methyltransferase domain-containing protein [Candidatus Bathyarchaeota archaeon]|nr:methyltransferase domain-containing protein [Candidatus Bathyarchaeum sp.]
MTDNPSYDHSKNHHNHLFDPKNIQRLESKDRKAQQDPQKIIKLLSLDAPDIVADLGCGAGYFAIPLSHRVSKVYGIDVQQEMLDYLAQKLQKQNITNIKLLLSKDGNQIPLESKSVTALLSVMTLHEFQDKNQMIKEIQRVLRPGGKVLIIDFKKEDAISGPPVSIRVSQQQAIELFAKENLSLIDSRDLKSHYLLIFQK